MRHGVSGDSKWRLLAHRERHLQRACVAQVRPVTRDYLDTQAKLVERAEVGKSLLVPRVGIGGGVEDWIMTTFWRKSDDACVYKYEWFTGKKASQAQSRLGILCVTVNEDGVSCHAQRLRLLNYAPDESLCFIRW